MEMVGRMDSIYDVEGTQNILLRNLWKQANQKTEKEITGNKIGRVSSTDFVSGS